MSFRNSRIWPALIPAMVAPFAASLFYFVIFSDFCLAPVIYIAAKVFAVVWPIISVRFILRTTFPKVKIGHEKHRRAIPLGALLGTAIVVLMFALMQTKAGELVAAGSDNIGDKARELGVLEHYWLFALFICTIHSLIEEYYWRWFVFGQLRKVVPVFYAHIIAGASFAAHHLVITTQFFPIFFGILLGGLAGAGGVILSVLYDRQKTLAGAWVCHLIVDIGIMAIGHNILFGYYI